MAAGCCHKVIVVPLWRFCGVLASVISSLRCLKSRFSQALEHTSRELDGFAPMIGYMCGLLGRFAHR